MSKIADAASGAAPAGTAGPAAEPLASGAPPTPPPGQPKEIGGPPGPEPTRYGDWQYKGRCTDF
jgi:hypothetical protein